MSFELWTLLCLAKYSQEDHLMQIIFKWLTYLWTHFPKGFVNVRKERRTTAFRNQVLVVPDDVAVIFKTNTNQRTVYIQRKMLNNVIRIFWRCRGSNPGHFTCKANALPLSHISISLWWTLSRCRTGKRILFYNLYTNMKL